MQRGAYKRYPLLFLYCIILFLSGIVEVAVRDSADYRIFYWINEAVLQILILAVMLSFLHRAMRQIPARRTVNMSLGIGIMLFSLYSLLTTEGTRLYTGLARNLSFVSALMNLALWLALMRGGRKDTQLLLLSAGIGIQTTGKAIGHSLRFLFPSRSTVDAGNILIVAVHLLCLLTWLYAFRPAFEPEESFDRGSLT